MRRVRPPRRKIAVVLVLAAVVLVATLAVVSFERVLYPKPEDPRRYFAQHRPEMEEVAALIEQHQLTPPPNRIDQYYGPDLPNGLRHLSVTGKVTIRPDGSFFLPRWTGIPDDAGGYWHSASSPHGEDMYGLACLDPLALADDWWSCGMANDGSRGS